MAILKSKIGKFSVGSVIITPESSQEEIKSLLKFRPDLKSYFSSISKTKKDGKNSKRNTN